MPVRGVEDPARRNPPAPVHGDVAALVAPSSFEYAPTGLGSRASSGWPRLAAFEDAGPAGGRQGQLVGLAGQGQWFDLAERREGGQVVLAVERADVLDEPLLLADWSAVGS